MDYIHYTYFVIKGKKNLLTGEKKIVYALNVMRLICIHTRFTWFTRARALDARTVSLMIIIYHMSYRRP